MDQELEYMCQLRFFYVCLSCLASFSAHTPHTQSHKQSPHTCYLSFVFVFLTFFSLCSATDCRNAFSITYTQVTDKQAHTLKISTHVFFARTELERDEWLSDINALVNAWKKNTTRIPNSLTLYGTMEYSLCLPVVTKKEVNHSLSS